MTRGDFLRRCAAGVIAAAGPGVLAGGATVRALAILPGNEGLLAGARFGAEEARRTAQLFGSNFELVIREAGTSTAAAAALRDAGNVFAVVGGGRAFEPGAEGTTPPFLEITDSSELIADGRYRLTPVAPSASTVAWHPDLKRFGAGELNERFSRSTGLRMDSEAWTAWLAMKLIVEAALNDREIASVRIDGHKGIPLRFDAHRVLQQPLYLVNDHGQLLDF